MAVQFSSACSTAGQSARDNRINPNTVFPEAPRNLTLEMAATTLLCSQQKRASLTCGSENTVQT